MIILDPLLIIVLWLIRAYIWVIIIGVILSWLIAFNVVNSYNRFVFLVQDFTNRLTEPTLPAECRRHRHLAHHPDPRPLVPGDGHRPLPLLAALVGLRPLGPPGLGARGGLALQAPGRGRPGRRPSAARLETWLAAEAR